MSSKELRRAGVLGRVESGELKLVDAAVLMGMSYRQSKRLAKRYREGGVQGLKHGSAGRESNRRKSKKFRERVLRLVGKKYSGEEGERFGPTLAAEQLASDDDVEVNAQPLRRWMLAEGAVESGAEAAHAPQAARAERTCGGTGADGWKFPPLVGGTRAGRVFDEHGGRCQRRHAGADGGGGDDRGSGGGVASLG